ncbi:MAG: glycosyltransferase [Acidobacteriota bacterium]|nr:glycosyltransferase [Acidobacteriota bacterium]
MSKILIITSSLQLGGIERVSSNLANEFSNAGHSIHYFCIFRHTPFFDLSENIVRIEPKLKKPQRFNILDAPIRIRKAVKKINPDSVLVFNKFYGTLTLLGLVGLNYPVYISERASPFYRFPLIIELFNNMVFLFVNPSGVIAQTEFAARCQRRFYKTGTPIRVINNPLREIEVFELLRKPIVLGVGRLADHLKGFDLLVEAWAHVKNKSWKLVLTGSRQENTKLAELAGKMNLHERIEFIGRVNDIDRLYAEAGMIVIPSRSEGFPNAMVEAMAAGLPVISFNFQAGPEEILVNNHNGILVENGNTEKLAEKIDLLIENKEERVRLGKNAKEIRIRLDRNKICREFLNFILPEGSFF